ncbi:hypothetical protein BJ508DRAFT_381772 [Ascobolus immersus RN42]|uniref:Uncharacterized protein n=1 Tax=Ascobolus immersus RN42 TaxID=1160509 RepID=A0A3N4HCE0_ASCIM|nr:hypothetical protein BJ508DRAFT_381772 [Ascobolus immersus RN42]
MRVFRPIILVLALLHQAVSFPTKDTAPASRSLHHALLPAPETQQTEATRLHHRSHLFEPGTQVGSSCKTSNFSLSNQDDAIDALLNLVYLPSSKCDEMHERFLELEDSCLLLTRAGSVGWYLCRGSFRYIFNRVSERAEIFDADKEVRWTYGVSDSRGFKMEVENRCFRWAVYAAIMRDACCKTCNPVFSTQERFGGTTIVLEGGGAVDGEWPEKGRKGNWMPDDDVSAWSIGTRNIGAEDAKIGVPEEQESKKRGTKRGCRNHSKTAILNIKGYKRYKRTRCNLL